MLKLTTCSHLRIDILGKSSLIVAVVFVATFGLIPSPQVCHVGVMSCGPRHVMYQGRILKSGGKELADKLDEAQPRLSLVPFFIQESGLLMLLNAPSMLLLLLWLRLCQRLFLLVLLLLLLLLWWWSSSSLYIVVVIVAAAAAAVVLVVVLVLVVVILCISMILCIYNILPIRMLVILAHF